MQCNFTFLIGFVLNLKVHKFDLVTFESRKQSNRYSNFSNILEFGIQSKYAKNMMQRLETFGQEVHGIDNQWCSRSFVDIYAYPVNTCFYSVN